MSLTFEQMQGLVENIMPRPGWHLSLVQIPEQARERLGVQSRLEITTEMIPNTRFDSDPQHQNREVALAMPRYPPPEAEQSENAFICWVLYEYLWLTMHEELEWFRDKMTGLPIVDAHDSELTVTRLLPPRPGEEWWRGLSDALGVEVTPQSTYSIVDPTPMSSTSQGPTNVTITSATSLGRRSNGEGRLHEDRKNTGVQPVEMGDSGR